MKRLEQTFVLLNGWALIVMLSAMAIVVGANISLRYLTAHSLPWADEVARYLMIWLTFTGAGLILRIVGHVAITNLQDVLPSTGQRVLKAFIVLILLAFFAFMLHVGWQYAQRMQFQVTPALRLPFLYVYLAMPVAFAMAISVFAAISLASNYPHLVVVKKMFSGLDSFPLLAVPFFILASEIMTGGAVTMAILRLAQSLVGHMRGGLGHANVIRSAMFAGISGSALADAAGLGSMMIRMMEKGGYDRPYAGAATVASAVVGPIIPPSITMIIYAMQNQNVSVGSLFMAGVLPGLLITLMVLLANAQVSKRRNYASGEPMPPLGTIGRKAFYALPALVLIVLIVGGIRLGIFTPTEASVIAVFYALLVGMFVYRSLRLRDLPGPVPPPGSSPVVTPSARCGVAGTGRRRPR